MSICMFKVVKLFIMSSSPHCEWCLFLLWPLEGDKVHHTATKPDYCLVSVLTFCSGDAKENDTLPLFWYLCNVAVASVGWKHGGVGRRHPHIWRTKTCSAPENTKFIICPNVKCLVNGTTRPKTLLTRCNVQGLTGDKTLGILCDIIKTIKGPFPLLITKLYT